MGNNKVTMIAAGMALLMSGCSHFRLMHTEPSVEATPDLAWEAWFAGDADNALKLGKQLIRDRTTANEGHHIAAMAAHVRGDYANAIAHFDDIDENYARRRELNRLIFESYMHVDKFQDALHFATVRDLSSNLRARAKSRVDFPLSVSISGVVDLAFEDDVLTPYLPGVAGHVNGRETVFRFDTGGTFAAMSPTMATRYGVHSEQCSDGFANLQKTQVCYGVADLALGSIRVQNAPVAVISSLPDEQLGVELGPVLGTNFLQRFLATIDAHNARLLLSLRGENSANAQQMALLEKPHSKAPFLLLSDHFILARGGAGDRRDLNFFVDSGLVAVDRDGVQAGLLIPRAEAMVWAGVSDTSVDGTIVKLDTKIELGQTSQGSQRALILPDAAWSSFGAFGGIGVNGLISYGYLKNYSWTLDFDQHLIILSQ